VKKAKRKIEYVLMTLKSNLLDKIERKYLKFT